MERLWRALGFVYVIVDVKCPTCKGVGFRWGGPVIGIGDPYTSVKWPCYPCGGQRVVKRWRWVWRPWA